MPKFTALRQLVQAAKGKEWFFPCSPTGRPENSSMHICSTSECIIARQFGLWFILCYLWCTFTLMIKLQLNLLICSNGCKILYEMLTVEIVPHVKVGLTVMFCQGREINILFCSQGFPHNIGFNLNGKPSPNPLTKGSTNGLLIVKMLAHFQRVHLSIWERLQTMLKRVSK